MEWVLYIILAVVLIAIIAALVLGLPDLMRYLRMRKM